MPRERKTDIPESVAIIGGNIKSIIKSKGLKTRYVAEKADLDIETFRRYISGRSQIMGIDKLVRISNALEISDYNELFEGL